MSIYDFKATGKARRIDSTEEFRVDLDLMPLIRKCGVTFVCSKCDDVLVRIEPGGILGDKLNQLDTTVILDHHLAKHAPS